MTCFLACRFMRSQLIRWPETTCEKTAAISDYDLILFLFLFQIVRKVGFFMDNHVRPHIIDTPTASWGDAGTTCLNPGGNFAIIRSVDENNFILDLIMKQQKVQDYGAWIGL